MAPILHCVRHAQGIHNLGPQYHGVRDPTLTLLGEEQCVALKSNHFPMQSNLALISASLLSRTLQTAFIAFQPALEQQSCQILALPDAQEVSDLACDTGSDVSDLVTRCKGNNWPVNVELLQGNWNVKTLGSRYSPASQAIEIRARDARLLLRSKFRELIAAGIDDPEVVLVTHGGFLHYFTGDWENSNKLLGTGWENCETRAYTYEEGIESDDVDARLVETTESRRKRGLSYPMFPHSKQRELYEKGLLAWEGQGLPNAGNLNSGNKELRIENEAHGQEPATRLVKTRSKSVEAAA